MELVGAKPLHLLTHTVPSLKSPTGAFIASQTLHSPLRCRSPLLTELARRKKHLAAKPQADAPRTVVDGTSRRPAEQRAEQIGRAHV